MNNWSIEKTDDYAHKLKFDTLGERTSKDSILALSDIHWDSKKCDRKKLKECLDWAVKNNTPTMIFGDLFDVMGGKYDKRKSNKCVRDEHKTDTYFDTIIDDAIEWFMPYKDILALVSYGNHEDSIVDRNETDLINRFVTGMTLSGSKVQKGGYWGYIAVQQRRDRHHCATKTIYYHHGFGGGGESTRGINQNMQTSRIAFADIYISGHIHRRNYDENIISCLNNSGSVIYKEQLFLRTSTFKWDVGGWAARMGMGPRPIGGWWIDFQLHSDGKQEAKASTT